MNNSKIVINSNGEPVKLTNGQNSIRTVKAEVRLNELQDVVHNLFSYLEMKGIDIQNKEVCYMIQDQFVKERVVFFTKTEVSSSSQFVKTANEIEKHPEILANPEKLYLYQSVVSDTTVNRPCWYYLAVGYIEIERNSYDGKRISIQYRSPIPYMQFIYDLKEQSENKSQYSYQLHNTNIILNNVISILPQAFDRDVSEDNPLLDVLITEVIDLYVHHKGISARNKNSNKANTCFMIINNTSSNIYPIYVVAKTIIKKTLRGSYSIKYNKNCVTANLKDDTVLSFYIGNNEENPIFLLNGNLIEGYDDFQNALINLSKYVKQDWYIKLVETNLISQAKE